MRQIYTFLSKTYWSTQNCYRKNC